MFKHFVYTLLFLALGIVQNTIFHSLPYIRHANFILVIFVCVILISQSRTSIFYALIVGLALGLFQFMPWWVYLVAAVLVWFVVKALYLYIFSGFSLISNTISIIAGTIVFDISTHVFNKLLTLFDLTGTASVFLDRQHLLELLWACLMNVVLMVLLFVAIARVSKLLNLAFIKPSKR